MGLLSFLTGTSSAPTGDTLGVDVSHWSGKVDWNKMKSKGVKWVIVKATDFYKAQPIGFVDSRCAENISGAKYAGLIVGGYCWLQPKVDPVLQARFYLDNFYLKYKPDFPPVVDFEDVDMFSPNDYLWRLSEWIRVVENETGRVPIIYTAGWFMNKFTDKSKLGWMARHPLWVAHYIQRSYPSNVAPWTSWKIWQYSDRGDYPYYTGSGYYGTSWGASSGYLDMNWFKGTYADLLEFVQASPLPPPQPPAPEPQPLFYARCKVSSLNIRSGVGTIYPIVGYLKLGDVVPVFEEKSGWYRIGTSKWCSGYYMEKVSATTPATPPVTSVLFQAKCLVATLNKRSGPGLTYSIVGYLKLGTVVNVYEVKNGWYRIEENNQVWVSGGTQYMQRL